MENYRPGSSYWRDEVSTSLEKIEEAKQVPSIATVDFQSRKSFRNWKNNGFLLKEEKRLKDCKEEEQLNWSQHRLSERKKTKNSIFHFVKKPHVSFTLRGTARGQTVPYTSNRRRHLDRAHGQKGRKSAY